MPVTVSAIAEFKKRGVLHAPYKVRCFGLGACTEGAVLRANHDLVTVILGDPCCGYYFEWSGNGNL